MESLNQFVNSLAPKLSHWRRDFHHYAESGWVEFRTATLVAEELQQLKRIFANDKGNWQGRLISAWGPVFPAV